MKTCWEYPDKKRYNTEKDAQTAILLIGDIRLRYYKCDTCDGWHLTSKDK